MEVIKDVHVVLIYNPRFTTEKSGKNSGFTDFNLESVIAFLLVTLENFSKVCFHHLFRVRH